MAWIESHQELRGHPKTKRLARMLGVSMVTAVGHLHFLWWWALEYAMSGDLSNVDPIDIADAAMWDADPEQFVSSMVKCGGGKPGFLEYVDGQLSIHDWDHYVGRLREQREVNAERQRRHREKRKKADEQTNDVTVMSPLHNDPTVPDRTGPQPDQTNDDDDARTRELDEMHVDDFVDEIESRMQKGMKKKSYRLIQGDYEIFQYLLTDDVERRFILDGIDEAFSAFKPQHRFDKIGSFSYCAHRIYGRWMAELARREATDAAASSMPRAAPSGPQQPKRAHSSQLDERYEKFYQLFPDMQRAGGG